MFSVMKLLSKKKKKKKSASDSAGFGSIGIGKWRQEGVGLEWVSFHAGSVTLTS